MDYAFERDWQTLVKRMMDRFGEEPDVTSMVFAVGLQEAGQGAKRFKKDEKMDLMHVGVCTLLEPLGYYVAGQAGFAVLDVECTKGSLEGKGLIKIEEMMTNEVTITME